MRFQDYIYVQNNVGCVRNSTIKSVTTSCESCAFFSPDINIDIADMLDCDVPINTLSSNVHILSANTLTYNITFSGNTDILNYNTYFRFSVFKFNPKYNKFIQPEKHTTDWIPYSDFHDLYSYSGTVETDKIDLDGEYIIKCFYKTPICSTFLKRLGEYVDTSIYVNDGSYGMYNTQNSRYFVAMEAAEKPNILKTPFVDESFQNPTIYQQVLLPQSGTTTFLIDSSYSGNAVITLNGLSLAKDYDYSLSGNVVTLFSETSTEDIITVIYNRLQYLNLQLDVIEVNTPVTSGVLDNQGGNKYYYNTTTNKYEVFLSKTPLKSSIIIVTINGVTMANNVDYYKSTTNPKRIILNGTIEVGDIINIIYNPEANITNGIYTTPVNIGWYITNPPQNSLGDFILELSSDYEFNDLNYSGLTSHVEGITTYNILVPISGYSGTELYYRIKNTKRIETICGEVLETATYSDIVPITIMNNSINTY